jgi:diguanylate cyclase (GGDEF)-like protein
MLPASEAMTAPHHDPWWLSCATALNAVGAAVYLKDAQGRYLLANEAAERVLGVAVGTLAGRVRLRLDPPGPGGAVLLGMWFELTPQRQAEAALRTALAQLEEQQGALETLRRELDSRELPRGGAGGGLYPAEQFDDHLRREVDLSMREHREFAVVLVALDPAPLQSPSHDASGRARVVEALARLLRGNTRAMDAPCWRSSESFAVLLSGVGLATAHSRMEGLRRQCATQLVVRDGEALRFTVSMGVASFPHTAQTQAGLVQAAADALGEAQRRGGNHVALASISFDPR